jgi:hypothetical protein
MAYCTVDDVQPYLIHVTLNTTSQPTKEQVSKLCDDVSDNIIDPIIRDVITLPLTDPVGLHYLQGGATDYVVMTVLMALYGATDVVIGLKASHVTFLNTLRTNNSVLIKPNDQMPKTQGSTRHTPRYTMDPDDDRDIW